MIDFKLEVGGHAPFPFFIVQVTPEAAPLAVLEALAFEKLQPLNLGQHDAVLAHDAEREDGNLQAYLQWLAGEGVRTYLCLSFDALPN